MSSERATAPKERLVTAADGGSGSRVYLVVDGVKRWIVSPAVFVAHGWRFEDVEHIPAADLDAIPTSHIVIGAPPSFAERDHARLRASARFLAGRGIEIGAGLSPQPLPPGVECEIFELRSPEEVARLEAAAREDPVGVHQLPSFRGLAEIEQRFPAGADFLIAHNVLEHCPEPIGTLFTWSGYLRTGGVLVLSVPDVDHCPDAGRLVPDLEHLLVDHLLGRDGDSFESREHAYSCAAGWMNFWEDWLPLDKAQVAMRMHRTAAMPQLDVHWHAFTPALFDQLLQATSLLAPRPLELLAWSDPQGTAGDRTVGDIIAVLRVGARLADDPATPPCRPDVAVRMRALAAKLTIAARRIDGL